MAIPAGELLFLDTNILVAATDESRPWRPEPRRAGRDPTVTAGHFSPGVSALLRLLSRREVRYLVVSGEAVIHYGYARLTGDIDGVSFGECWGSRTEADVDADLRVSYIGLADLVRNKEASARDKDRDDLRFLRRLLG